MAQWLRKLLASKLTPPSPSLVQTAGPPQTAPIPPTSEARRREGNAHLDRGDLTAAVAAYRDAVALAPDSVDAHIGLGYALQESRQWPAALEALAGAARLQPENFDAAYLAGQVCMSLQRPAEAAGHFTKALALRGAFEPLYGELCQALFQTGALDQARQAIALGIQNFPNNATFHLFLGNLHFQRNESDEASACYVQALRLNPNLPGVHGNLGAILTKQGNWQAALASFDRAVQLDGRELDFQMGRYQCLFHLGRRDEALQALHSAQAIAPHAANVQQNLGFMYLQAGRHAEAESHSRKALAIDPLNADAHNNLNALLIVLGRFNEAEKNARTACALNPTSAIFQSNLGGCLLRQGRLMEAEACFRQAVELDPRHIESGSNLLFALSADPRASPADYLAEARRVGQRLTTVMGAPFVEWPAANTASESSPLRVGLVSGHLCNGSVGYFLEGLVAHLDPAKVQLIAYYTGHTRDALSERIQPRFSQWNAVQNLRAHDLAQKIHDDGIQVLIDLNGHTEGNSLPVFALKPAPVQVSWLGYWASTGLPTIDFVLADPACVPAADRVHFTERLRDMPHTRLCFTPPTSPLQVGPPPCLRQPFFTFGSYQSLTKIHDGVLAAWGRVLQAVPHARLHLTSHQVVSDATFQQLFDQRLLTARIDPARVTVAGPVPREAYLASYAQIDIVLDTFPYTGGTTTCEALWMGVPTLTIRGDSMIARQGASMLECVGLTDWIAQDEDDYVALAVAHAGALDQLAALRLSLRDRALSSPLFDTKRFARDWEAALQAIWREGGMPLAQEDGVRSHSTVGEHPSHMSTG